MPKNLLMLTMVIAQTGWAGMSVRPLRSAVGAYQAGKKNLITDVPGVKVGHATIHKTIDKSVARTGVTVVLPSTDDLWTKPMPAAVYTFNGVGEAAGFAIIRESGVLQTPVALTNTLSVGDVQKALAKWVVKRHPETESPVPVVMECDDSSLNDIHGFHVSIADVNQAIETASDKFQEGSVGAGTGMISYDFKSGIGSASRQVSDPGSKKQYTLGVLVNSNIGTGTRNVFRFFGVPVGLKIQDLMPTERPWDKRGTGSTAMVVATDAPLDSRQLERLAKRAFSGVLRTGTPGYNGSGDFVVAFSTANRSSINAKKSAYSTLCDPCLNDFFEAVADATEEAVLSSMLASQDTTGRNGNQAYALPASRLTPLLKLAE